jgi:hypothetical protein
LFFAYHSLRRHAAYEFTWLRILQAALDRNRGITFNYRHGAEPTVKDVEITDLKSELSGHNSNRFSWLRSSLSCSWLESSKNFAESGSFCKSVRLRICSKSPMLRVIFSSLRMIATSK